MRLTLPIVGKFPLKNFIYQTIYKIKNKKYNLKDKMKQKSIYVVPRINVIQVAVESRFAQVVCSPINPKAVKVVDWEQEESPVEGDLYVEFYN
jgi:hypothetical protein